MESNIISKIESNAIFNKNGETVQIPLIETSDGTGSSWYKCDLRFDGYFKIVNIFEGRVAGFYKVNSTVVFRFEELHSLNDTMLVTSIATPTFLEFYAKSHQNIEIIAQKWPLKDNSYIDLIDTKAVRIISQKNQLFVI